MNVPAYIRPSKDDHGDWFTTAACRGVDPNLFHPGPSEAAKVAQARAICATCPHAGPDGPCVQYALATNSPGVYGGYSARERLRLFGRYLETVHCTECHTPFSRKKGSKKLTCNDTCRAVRHARIVNSRRSKPRSA